LNTLFYLHICQPIFINGFTLNSINRPGSSNYHNIKTKVTKPRNSSSMRFRIEQKIPTTIVAFPLGCGDDEGWGRRVPAQQVGGIGVAKP